MSLYTTRKGTNDYTNSTKLHTQNVKLLLNKEDIASLPFYKRILAYKNDSYEVDKDHYDTLLYNNRKYLLVCCPTRNISRRIDVLTYQKTRNE